MRFFSVCSALALVAMSTAAALAGPKNSTYHNPILAGWHSDPSCIQVDGTFYCVISTFISFPGLPIYASKDLMNWKLIGHTWNRESQIPGYSWATKGQQEGMYAATLRFNDGVFYVICTYLGSGIGESGVLFKTTDPYTESTWTDSVMWPSSKIDPDLFWDDDGKVYVASQGIILEELNLDTGELGPAVELWNGTGGVWPEGPHIYKRPDGYYYLLIAEGGTATDHAITIARAKSITGPYTPHPNNPILSNRGTDEFFQTVGHGDLFQDAAGNWWGTSLATRSGPAYASYPMGRETVLFPVTWNDGDWPVLQPVRGEMSGWPLPKPSRDLPGDGPFNADPDRYDLTSTAPLPRNLVHWRVPREGAFTPTERGLKVVLGRTSLSGEGGVEEPAAKAVSFVGRRQTDSLFRFGVDLEFEPTAEGQEAGVTAFLTQNSNVQLGVVLVGEELMFRFNVSGEVKESAVPEGWAGERVRLEIDLVDSPHEFVFAASSLRKGGKKERVVVGTASAELLSGGSGSFVGTLLGVYATCNGAGEGLDCPEGTPDAYFTKWTYTGEGQYISETEVVRGNGKGKGKGKKN
jgi:beta-xylosidase